MKTKRSNIDLRPRQADVSDLFAHLFAGLVLGTAAAFVLAGAIVIIL